MAAQNIGKGRAAAKRRRQTALDNLLKNKTQSAKRTAEQKQAEIETLQARIKAG